MDGVRPLPADEALLEGRCAVLAVGSNADPDWLRAKLLRHEVSPVVPMTRARVRGVRAGHSAHVSVPGFIPAAPYDAPGSTARLWVEWFDSEQLEAIDRTEPNYDRCALDLGRYEVELVGSGERLTACAVYVGHHGVLTDAAGQVLELRPQADLLDELLHGDLALAELAGPTPADWVAATSASAHLRQELKARFEAAGRVAGDGLGFTAES
ncbi:MAG TPA: hypothetical protein VD926_04660 [Acidimicrobiales bacterium]|nr:hypothetical protein [Acidimicrobiales bacterium]